MNKNNDESKTAALKRGGKDQRNPKFMGGRHKVTRRICRSKSTITKEEKTRHAVFPKELVARSLVQSIKSGYYGLLGAPPQVNPTPMFPTWFPRLLLLSIVSIFEKKISLVMAMPEFQSNFRYNRILLMRYS